MNRIVAEVPGYQALNSPGEGHLEECLVVTVREVHTEGSGPLDRAFVPQLLQQGIGQRSRDPESRTGKHLSVFVQYPGVVAGNDGPAEGEADDIPRCTVGVYQP